LPDGLWVFAGQCFGKGHGAGALLKVLLVLGLDCRKMGAQGLDQRAGQDGVAILPALASAHGDFAALKVDVLHPQMQSLQQAKATAIQQTANQP